MTRRFGVAVAFLALAAPVAASAAMGNAVRNGNAESGRAATSDSSVVAPAGWKTTGKFTAVRYGGSGLPSSSVAKAIHGGKAFFAGGPGNRSSSATQTVSLGSGYRTAVLSAALGGWTSQPDAATVRYRWLDATGKLLATSVLGPVTPAQRGNATKLIAVHKTVKLPAKARRVAITIAAIRGSGSYNDGYADNVSLRLRR